MDAERLRSRWAAAWACLAAALGVHVADEALTGFLPRYNAVVEAGRDTLGWLPFPTFTFRVWLGGLVLGVALLFALTPLVRRGLGWLRPFSYVLGVLMTANALGHLSASLWLGEWFPGVYSSPVLLASAIALLVATAKAWKREPAGGSRGSSS